MSSKRQDTSAELLLKCDRHLQVVLAMQLNGQSRDGFSDAAVLKINDCGRCGVTHRERNDLQDRLETSTTSPGQSKFSSD